MFHQTLANTVEKDNIYVVKLVKLKFFLNINFFELEIGVRSTLRTSSDVQALLRCKSYISITMQLSKHFPK